MAGRGRQAGAGTTETAAPLPAGWEAQLATLAAPAPAGDDWLHEIKLDGYRIGCRIDHGTVRLAGPPGQRVDRQVPRGSARPPPGFGQHRLPGR